MVEYPSVMPIPTANGYTFNRGYGFIQSSFDAKLRNQHITDDALSLVNVEFRLKRGQARLFYQWITDKLDRCKKPFTMRLRVDGGIVTQTGNFTSSGIPQLVQLDGNYALYRGQIRVRKVTEVSNG